MNWRSVMIWMLIVTCIVSPAAGQSLIVGVSSVIDGDTLEIRGQRIRLHGIDAPEKGQQCERNSKQYRCGQVVALALADKVGQRTVWCEQRDVDRYKRIVAACRSGGEDLNAWMVLHGHAVAYRRYSLDYIHLEKIARSERRGVWAGEFTLPWLWRRAQRH